MEIKKSFKIIARSLDLLIHNLKLSVPFLFQFIVPFMVILPFLAWLLYPEALSESFQPDNIEAITALIQSKLSVPFIASAVIAVMAIVLFSAFLFAGIIGISHEINEGREIRIRNVFSYGKKYWLKTLLVLLYAGAIFIGISLAAGLIIRGLSSFIPYEDVLSYASSFILLLALLFFVPAPYLAIMRNASVTGSVKESFLIVKKNFLPFLVLNAVLFLSAFILDLMPVIGQLLNTIVIYPVISLSIVQFVSEAYNKKSRG